MKRFRAVPYELKVLRVLYPRQDFSEKGMFNYYTAEKGYEGELEFDKLTNTLRGERYILNDLLLKLGNTYFQIDTTVISQSILHFFEVKNYEGDYYLDSGKFYKIPGEKEIKNPFIQLERSESLMRQLLQQNGFKIQVKGFVCFVNPEFSLFQAPRDLPIILPSQLNRFIINMDKQPSKLKNEFHKHLAETLISLHQERSPFTQLPAYDFEHLKKMVTCPRSYHFMKPVGGKSFVCAKCGYKEGIESVILRHVEEFSLIFPERKITTHAIYVWCGGYIAESTIRKYLKKHYNSIGFGRWVYFE
ncbi:nuclease-related domain-containing protein [Neobacillus kokaensis]|nr:nuclease-related domain-containing protein [Neobacillus kokaensis]